MNTLTANNPDRYTDTALRDYIAQAEQCIKAGESFGFFETNYAIPPHISPIAWSRAVQRSICNKVQT